MSAIPWHYHHDNIVRLTRYLADHNHTASEVADAVEKPWHYEDEFRAAEAEDEEWNA